MRPDNDPGPGTAVIVRRGEAVVVESADDLIRFTPELVTMLGLSVHDVLVLDTEGRYRYRRVPPGGPPYPEFLVYQRIHEEEPPCPPDSPPPSSRTASRTT